MFQVSIPAHGSRRKDDLEIGRHPFVRDFSQQGIGRREILIAALTSIRFARALPPSFADSSSRPFMQEIVHAAVRVASRWSKRAPSRRPPNQGQGNAGTSNNVGFGAQGWCRPERSGRLSPFAFRRGSTWRPKELRIEPPNLSHCGLGRATCNMAGAPHALATFSGSTVRPQEVQVQS